MPFSQAIYYPWIDITDEAWLKTSLLYWDSVRTIVPKSIDFPYSSTTAQALQDAGFLIPLRVDSDMQEIQELVPQVLAHLNSRAGIALASGKAHKLARDIHVRKLPPNVRQFFKIHPQKLPDLIRSRIQHKSNRGDQWLAVDEGFAMFYMTLLANRLAERIGAAVVTPLPIAERVAIAARLDSRRATSSRDHHWQWREYEAFGPRRLMPKTLAHGTLAELTIQQISISANTSIDDILHFKNAHKDELARFRTEISNLAAGVNEDLPIEALSQHIFDIYSNQVEPAVSDLQKSLSGRRISWFAQGSIKIASLSAAPLLIAARVPGRIGLLANAVLSFVVLKTLYNVDKRDTLQKDQFSYLLSIQKDLS